MTAIKCSAKLLAVILLTAQALAANPAPQVEARLQASKADPYQKETFILTLEIITRDIEIDPQLDLAQLPGSDIMAIIGSFEAMAVQRERTDNQEITRRQYRARARAMAPGTIELAPVLQLTARQRVRSFFGSAMEVRPVRLQVPTLTLNIKPIPTAPAGFSGIIGNFQVSIQADPLDIQAGDLVTITTTLRGEGWVSEDTIPAMPAASRLRSYRVRTAQTEENPHVHIFTQTVVPLEESLQALPAMHVIWFNTANGSFQKKTAGPFPLQYVQDSTPATTASDETTDAPDNDLPSRRGHFQQNRATLTEATRAYLAPATTSKSTFTIPAMGAIRIIDRHQNWLLIDHNNNRGWIPTP